MKFTENINCTTCKNTRENYFENWTDDGHECCKAGMCHLCAERDKECIGYEPLKSMGDN